MKVLILFFALITLSESAKILSIFSVASPSSYIYGSALLKELAARGHEVTSVNVYPQKKPVLNFRDIFIEKNLYLLQETVEEAQDGTEEDSIMDALTNAFEISRKLCINIYEHPEFKELLKNGKFDLIIIEMFLTDSFYGLGDHFNAQMVAVSTFGTMMDIDEIVGNLSPNSIIPSVFSTFPSKMTFWQRVQNMFDNIQIYFMGNFRNYYIQKELYHKYLPHAKIDYDTARKNISLLILNQHHTLSYPRPYVTNVIEAGGLHIKKNPDPLPSDLQKWLDDAPNGVVYFSMGSNIKSKDLPPHIRDIFLNVFRKLKQKVLWKFEDSHLPNKPDNVLINPWLQQPSVLKHPNVKVFITHGGLLSTTEAIFFAKPILGIPMFADQPRNVNLAKNRGIALSINISELNEKDLTEALNELLYNKIYREKMNFISAVYHDQPLTPMENAIYWIEYVLRHGGAHLKNSGIDLNVFQYYSVDVVGFYIAIFILILSVPLFIVKKIKNSMKSTKLEKKKKQ